MRFMRSAALDAHFVDLSAKSGSNNNDDTKKNNNRNATNVSVEERVKTLREMLQV